MESQNEKKQEITFQRIAYLIIGNFFIGTCVASYRISVFGVDAYSSMNLGISGFLGMSFGNWQLIMNVCILSVIFLNIRRFIGLGTIINMVFVGYIADFLCWLVRDVMKVNAGLPLRVIFLCIGMILCSLGCALYMEADLGLSPYDSVPFLIMKFTKDKVSFRMARVSADVTVMLIGVVFCLAAHNNVWEIVGIGTVINAFCNGPLMQFFRTRMTKTTD
ncbi:YczE/YyaS/YitT family protein [Parablautia muri]|uniref:YitT family protein n=1 Tax=Parablautia muri TaxID=2320879 RepID=A0A9X5GQU8_9FIRM|nr:hypothetical protein [Parablautia muri]NBJ92603.1 hypothetical protein [Parablautia muri]